MLVDWDTALVAPPERDLWSLAAEDPSIIDQYEASTGIRVERHALDLYRLTWDLTEIALYVDQFRRPHGDTEDTRVAWAGLECHLDPVRWSAPGS